MELLLNLAWLLLALPACWLWRRGTSARRFSSLQCLLALAGVLVMLFPVVSATDDLHAMRTEIEESPISKRSLHHTGTEKAPDATIHWQGAAVPTESAHPFPGDVHSRLLPLNPSLFVPGAPAVEFPGRAPPRRFAA